MKKFPPKQPYEEYYVGFSFARRLGTNSISNATVTVMNDAATPVDVTATLTDVNQQNVVSTVVHTWVMAGVHTHTYTLTCKIIASNGEKFELEGTMLVKDV